MHIKMTTQLICKYLRWRWPQYKLEMWLTVLFDMLFGPIWVLDPILQQNLYFY